MRRYSHAFRVLMDQELFNLLAEASTKTGIPKSRFVRYAIQPFSYTELAPGTTDWNDVYRTDPDPEHPLKRGRQLNVMLTGDEYEMLCRAAFKLGIARSAWVRERVYALLCRSYADELSPLTDASIRDNATMLLKELKTKDAGRLHSKKRKSPFPFVEEGITPNDHPPSCVFLCARMDMSMDTHMDTSMDIHMDMSMDIHMEMPIKSKVSKLDGSCT